jgi:small subunit ribosomal protein S20
MANIASQKKRILRSERERNENRLLTSTVKTHFRRLEAAVEGGDADAIATEQRDLVSKVDKAVQKGALHKNTGARKKAKAARIAGTARPGQIRVLGRSRAEHATLPASLICLVRRPRKLLF